MLLLLATLAQAGTTVKLPFEVDADYGSGEYCTSSREDVEANAEYVFDVTDDQVADITAIELKVEGRYQNCRLDIYDLELELDGTIVWAKTLNVAIDESGLSSTIWGYSTTEFPPDLLDELLYGGSHTLRANLTGRTTNDNNAIRVTLRARVEYGRDWDDDGYEHILLTGGDDCDDDASAINPGATEIWYDGTDQDCDLWSDYDQDFDGYDSDVYGGDDCDDTRDDVSPGVEAADDIWYDGVDSDCAGNDDYDQDGDGDASADYTGTDCDDTDPDIYFGAEETWYDGIDSDCREDDDYDQDGDGFQLAGHADVEGDDCDDTDPDIHPDAEELWYDGVDQDCAGDDDYDQDGDGSRPSTWGGDDCDDTDPDIYVGAEETWYDGIDQDCAGDDDFDQDGDGYRIDGVEDGDDCDDTRDDVNPGVDPADDVWYDGVDQDCAGNSDYDQDGDGFDSYADTPGNTGTDCDDLDPDVVEGTRGWSDECVQAVNDDGSRTWSEGEGVTTSGCACTTGGTAPVAWLGLGALLLGLVRRRR